MKYLFTVLSLLLANLPFDDSKILGFNSDATQPRYEVVLQKGTIKNQIIQENTIYVITKSIDLKEKVKGVTLDFKINVNGQEYYSHITPVSLVEGQLIWVPKRCVLLNENKEVVSLSGETYCPHSQCNVFLASKTKRKVSYKRLGLLVIPNNCTLKFSGGKIKNGCILGQATKIYATGNALFDHVTISGDWDCPTIKSEWFTDAEAINGLKNVFALSNNRVNNTIEIKTGKYIVSHTSYDDTPIKPKSNTKVILNGDIIEQANCLKEYYTVYVKDVQNLIIEGNGRIIGDRDEHPEDVEGEKGHGITIQNSRNILIKDITVKDCWGDCIYVGTSATNYNVTIDGCRIERGRRTGIAIVNADGYQITNCSIVNIGGTPTEYGIDIEPNAHPSHVCMNGLIQNNIFDTKLGLYIQSQTTGTTGSLKVQNNTFNCEKNAIQLTGGEDVLIKDNNITSNDIALFLIRIPNTPRSALFISNKINGTVRGAPKSLNFTGNTIYGVCFFESECDKVVFNENICYGLVNFAKGDGGNVITGNTFEYPLEVRMSSTVKQNRCNDVISIKDCEFENNIVSVSKPKMNRQNAVLDLDNSVFSNNDVTVGSDENGSLNSVFRLLSNSSVITGNTINNTSQKTTMFNIDPNIKDKTTLSRNNFTRKTTEVYPKEGEKKLLWK